MQRRSNVPSASVALWLVALPFLLLIVAEIAVLWLAFRYLGWWALVLLAVTTLLGIYLLQREWSKSWNSLAGSLRTGQLPPGKTADAVLVLIGGGILIMPGFITDALGLLLLIPFTRRFVRSGIGWWAGRALRPASGRRSRGDTVIPGEVVEGEVVEGDIVPGTEPEPPTDPRELRGPDQDGPFTP